MVGKGKWVNKGSAFGLAWSAVGIGSVVAAEMAVADMKGRYSGRAGRPAELVAANLIVGIEEGTVGSAAAGVSV